MERRSLKKSRLQRDSNPWYRCDALPTELWSHTLGARPIYWVHISREEWNDVKHIWNNSYIWTAVVDQSEEWKEFIYNNFLHSPPPVMVRAVVFYLQVTKLSDNLISRFSRDSRNSYSSLRVWLSLVVISTETGVQAIRFIENRIFIST